MIDIIVEQGVYFIRIILACICGGIIGIERQQRTKVAGTKTHMMIALAAALMMIISKYGFTDVVSIEGLQCDVSRVAAGIITGVGILGGGIIITGKQGYVSGITTAAGIWVTIAIGMAIGCGMYVMGIGTTIIVMILQFCLHRNLWIVKQSSKAQVSFRFGEGNGGYDLISKRLMDLEIVMYQIKWERKSNNTLQLRCQVVIPARYTKDEIVKIFTTIPEMETFEVV